MTIFVSLHHKRSLLFEEGIRLILKDFPVLILNTGLDNGFGEFGVKHPNLEYIDVGSQIPYDEGVVRLKDILSTKEWDIVHFIDNDLFVTDTSYFKKTIEEFAKSDLGYCSYFENGFDDTKYKELEEVKEAFEVVPEYPGFKPNPHWENAAMMFKREAWDKLTHQDLSHGRLCIKAMFDKGIKMGVKHRKSKLPYSHYGDGWFHVGNLMAYYYKVENLDSDLNPESEIDLERIGYFLAQKKHYEDSAGFNKIYSSQIEINLNIIAESLGGSYKCLSAWEKLYEHTN